MKLPSTLLILVLIAGCSYPVKPDMRAASIDVNLQQKGRLPGVWKLAISEKVANISEKIIPYTRHCSGMNYPIAVGQQLSGSINQVMSSLFENIDKGYDKKAVNGVVTVELENFQIRVGCFAMLKCTANSQLGLHVTAKDLNGTILVEKSIQQSAEKSGFEGLACEGVATVLANALSQNISDSLQQVGVVLSESPKLRNNKL